MGLLDQLGSMLGQGGSSEAMSAISNLIDQQGGLGGLVQKLQNGGLRDVVASWVGTGENLPVSAEALQQVLGNSSEIAEGTGTEEHVHQLRIGLRRLRTALRQMYSEGWVQALYRKHGLSLD